MRPIPCPGGCRPGAPEDGAPGERAEPPKAPLGFRARPLLAPAGHGPVHPHGLRADPASAQRGCRLGRCRHSTRRSRCDRPSATGLTLCHRHPGSSRGPRAYGPGHQQPFSVQSNCFRQKHQTLSSECELCTCHLSGVICKKQMFEIIMHFSRNQGRFRLRRSLWEMCIVLTEFGRHPGSHT